MIALFDTLAIINVVPFQADTLANTLANTRVV